MGFTGLAGKPRRIAHAAGLADDAVERIVDMPADPQQRADFFHQVVAVVDKVAVEIIALKPRRDRIHCRRPVCDHHIDFPGLRPQQLRLVGVFLQVPLDRPPAIHVEFPIKVVEAVLEPFQVSALAPAEQVRVPRRPPEPHAVDRDAFADQVVEVFMARRKPAPGGIRVLARLPAVVLVVSRNEQDRGDGRLLLDEPGGLHAGADVARQHQHIPVGDRVEIPDRRIVAPVQFQVQVGGDLDSHGPAGR